MVKFRIVCWFVTAAVGVCLATAQKSQVRSSSANADPLQVATKPLTPKSAMRTKSKSAPLAPNASKSGRNTTAELNHLERQNGKAPSSKNSSAGQTKGTTVKSTATPSGSGSGISATYQKPKVPKKN
jgi:hypothetical protein